MNAWFHGMGCLGPTTNKPALLETAEGRGAEDFALEQVRRDDSPYQPRDLYRPRSVRDRGIKWRTVKRAVGSSPLSSYRGVQQVIGGNQVIEVSKPLKQVNSARRGAE